MRHFRGELAHARKRTRWLREANPPSTDVAKPSRVTIWLSRFIRFLSVDQGFDSVRAVRQAAALFFAAGVIGLVSDLLLGGIADKQALSLTLDTANLVIGCSCWLFLRNRLFGYRALVLVVIALTDVAFNNVLGEIAGGTLGIWFVVVFVWIGAWFPPRTSLLATPFAVLAYVLPYRFAHPPSGGDAGSVLYVIPAAVLVGITISLNAATARRAEFEQHVALEALAKANVTDDLTSLGNRRFGNGLLDSLCPGDVVAVLDLDRFKEVNDHYGHSTGDRVLQELGAFLATTFGETSLIARMGGEEFLLVYRQISIAEGALRTEQIVRAWRSREPLSTLSAGVAQHREGESPSITYRLADEALYLAKSRGRDQVAIERRTGIRMESTLKKP
jgi:diguanylate cyclase (GGDEF)-like protein